MGLLTAVSFGRKYPGGFGGLAPQLALWFGGLAPHFEVRQI
ncbi:hypothetical protein SAMN04487859_11344 [Roseovarius lutimaris]|uniref:Uncharacterized protein n=1 Tax=Roseovarius lutimaris TaxID=1005928 RepID=A0A1I5DPR7_9RHOB|nr:hypothetical protein SAMN04487859_11344 [Roseovarius lutimaris]